MASKNKTSWFVKHPRIVRYGLPILSVCAFAAIGSYLLVHSHAATITSVQFLNYQSAEQTQGVTNVETQVESLGLQTVSQVAPGAKLSYAIGSKVAFSNQCYYVRVILLKGGGTTATVVFTGQGNSITRQLEYNASTTSFQQVCVPSGTQPLKDFNVYNKSPVTGPALQVYQDIVSL